MLKNTRKSFVLAAAMTAAFAVPSVADDANPAYLVAQLNITDLQTYMQDYGMPVFPQLIAAGGDVLVATPKPSVSVSSPVDEVIV